MSVVHGDIKPLRKRVIVKSIEKTFKVNVVKINIIISTCYLS